MNEAEQVAQLTNVQTLNALYALLKRVEVIEAVLLQHIRGGEVQSQFLTEQILRARMETMEFGRKTPSRRLAELETLIKGFITYHETKDADVKKTKYNVIT